MAGRMKGYPDTVDFEWLAITDHLYRRTFVQPSSRDEGAITSHQVVGASPAEVVGMCVCDHGAVDRTPGVYEKSPLVTVQPNVCHAEQ